MIQKGELGQKIMFFNFFYVFSRNNQNYVIFDKNNLVGYQFDVAYFIPHVLRDIRSEPGVVECRKMKNYRKNVNIGILQIIKL